MKLVIAVAAVLIAGAVALVLIMSGGSDATTTTKRASGGTVTPTSTSPTVAPSLPADPSSGSAVAVGSDNVREYMVDGTKIRDHRSGSNVPRDIPVNAHAANMRELPSELTHDISQQVKRAIYDCAGQVAKEVKGDKPKVVGQLVVAIKDHKLSITNIALETRDINDEAAAATLKQCSQDNSANFTSVAKDQPDIADYPIQLNFAIP